MTSFQRLRLLPLSLTLATALGAAVCLSGCPSGQQEPIRVSVQSGNGAEAHTTAEIVELARAEGELLWYTSLAEGDAQALLSAFSRKYPFIRTRLVRGGSFTVAEKLASELASGQVEADALHLIDPATFVQLREQGALLFYDSPEAKEIPTQYQDQGYWVAMRAVTVGMAYNPTRLVAAEAPRGWQDLLQARFQGKIGLKDAETAGAGYALLFLLRERFGTDFWQRLGAQHPKTYKTESQMEDALARGEIAVAAGVLGGSREGGPAAARLTVVWPAEGVPMTIGPVAILAAAPHPNCARLFLDYLLSQEGQQLVVDRLEAYSVRPGLAPPKGRLPLSKLRLITPAAGWTDYASKRDLLRSEFSELMGPGGE
ncbi:MAG TPA: extracellular solute-binding protein [Armatimonadota bacterium]|jgi:iron(III) transport system substrate-binding protein